MTFDFIVRHTDGRIALVSSISDTQFVVSTWAGEDSYIASEPPLRSQPVDSASQTLRDYYDDATTLLGAGWTLYVDGVATAVDPVRVRPVPPELPLWCVRVEVTARGLDALVDTALAAAPVTVRGIYQGLWARGTSLRRDGAVVRYLISSGTITGPVANAIFRVAGRSLAKI